MRPSRRSLLAGMAGAGVGGLAGCVSDLPSVGSRRADTTRVSDRTLKLGTIYPLSGDLDFVGVPIRDAALLPIEQLRDEDVPFEFDVMEEDSETSPSAGVKAALRLVEAGYPMVNGALASGVTLQATQQVLIPYRTVSCSPASTSPTITTINDIDLVFRTAVSDSLQAVVLAEMAAQREGYSSAATLYVNNDYGYQLSRAFARSFETEFGGTVTTQVPFPPAPEEGEISYTEELETARADDPELLVLIGYPDSGAQLLRDFHESGGDEAIMVTDGLQAEGLQEEVGHSLAGIRGTAPRGGGPGQEFVTDLYEDTYEDATLTPFNTNAYDATAVLLLANAFAGQNDGTAIRNAMHRVTSPPGERILPADLATGLEKAANGEDVEYVGASSNVRFDENGDMRDALFAYWEYDDDGKINEIDTVEA